MLQLQEDQDLHLSEISSECRVSVPSLINLLINTNFPFLLLLLQYIYIIIYILHACHLAFLLIRQQDIPCPEYGQTMTQ